MRRVLPFALIAAALAAFGSVPAAQKKTPAPAKPKIAFTGRSKTAHTTSTPGSKARTGSKVVARGHSSKNGRSRVAPGPTYQLHPDPERYQQIQQALADRGYFKGAVDGQWGDDSVDALKRFQADQRLSDDGKLGALTLLGLGLGPRHDGSSATDVPLAPPSELTPGASSVINSTSQTPPDAKPPATSSGQSSTVVHPELSGTRPDR